MKINHSDRRHSTRRLFDERERMIRTQVAGHAFVLLVILFFIQMIFEEFFGSFLAEPIFAWILLCVVTFVVISVEMLVRRVMFSRMQSPLFFELVYLWFAVLNFIHAGKAFFRGEHILQAGILTTGGFNLIVGLLSCLMAGIVLIWFKLERTPDREVNSIAKVKPLKHKANYLPYKKNWKQPFDEREMQLHSNTPAIGLILLVVVTGINALLAQYGIRWARPVQIYIYQMLSVAIVMIVIALLRSSANRLYTINSIVCVFVFTCNFTSSFFLEGGLDALIGKKPFIVQNMLSDEGAELVLSTIYMLGSIAISFAIIYTKWRLKREENE
jgi:hypothetical protein